MRRINGGGSPDDGIHRLTLVCWSRRGRLQHGFLLANQYGEKLLYATDTFYIRYRFKALTHLMLECNYSFDILKANVEAGTVDVSLKNRILKSHMSLETLKGFLKANDLSRVEQIWLLHVSDGNSDADRFKREVMELTGKPVFIA